VAERYFTPDEANEALREVRPLVARMVARRRRLRDAQERHGGYMTAIGGNGGGIQPGELARAGATLEQCAIAVAECVERIRGLGIHVKDLDTGLVDFPALRAGEEVLLCWRLGEPEVGYWHGVDEGFAGRRPLPL
jgi:hypothetical protein